MFVAPRVDVINILLTTHWFMKAASSCRINKQTSCLHGVLILDFEVHHKFFYLVCWYSLKKVSRHQHLDSNQVPWHYEAIHCTTVICLHKNKYLKTESENQKSGHNILPKVLLLLIYVLSLQATATLSKS